MYKPGEILYAYLDGAYHVYKILRTDDFGTHHTLVYEPLDHIPTNADLDSLKVRAWHAPIGDFPASELIAVRPVTQEELQGYLEFLRMTNFEEYVRESGQDLNEIISRAKESFQRGYYLSDEGKVDEAIEAYTDAVTIFPYFYEAIDNRAFLKMDRKDYPGAIADFKWSLKIEPGNFTAAFSIGECYYRLDNRADARTWFGKALEIEPDNFQAKAWLRRLEP